jgi:hypothetical protein
MKNFIQNEVLGVLALQEVMRAAEANRISPACALFILPLVFIPKTRSILKNKNLKIVSARDLVASYSDEFSSFSNRFDDLLVASFNAQLLALDLGVSKLDDGRLSLRRQLFSDIQVAHHGRIAFDIASAAPNVALLMREDAAELYESFRVVI